jgi:hypothetical protein
LKQLNRPRTFSSFFSPAKFASFTLMSYIPSPPQCRLFSDRHGHDATPYHSSFPLNQDDIATSTSSSGSASSRRLPSQLETVELNPHHHSRPSSPDRPTLTLYCYKNNLNIDHSPYHSITSSFYLLSNHSITLVELHPSPSFPFIIVSYPQSLHIITHTLMK